MAIEFTSETLQEAVNSGATLVVKFYSNWCGPCRMLNPILQELETEYTGATFGQLNGPEQPMALEAHNVVGVPTVILFKDGVEVTRVVGYKNKQEMINLLLSRI